MAGRDALGKVSVNKAPRAGQRFTAEEYEAVTMLCRLTAQALDRIRYFNRSNQLQLMWGSLLHYFATPAHNIQFGWQVIREQPSGPQRDRAIEDLAREIELLRARADAAVGAEQLLTGGVAFAKETSKLGDIAADAIGRYNGLGYAVRITELLPSEPVWVFVNPKRVSEVLTGVIENAAVHAEPRSITVKVETQGTKGMVSVTDDGSGIPKEVQSLLFQPYAKIGAKSRHRGTGLGLFLAKQVALSQGGNLTVESKDGGPTTFTFSFPLAVRRG
jgi:signal transduction histidine kinase